MTDYTIYRNGNCTVIGTSDADEEIYIAVDLDHLRESNLNDSESYCHETITCGTNYVSLRKVPQKNRLLVCLKSLRLKAGA